MFKKITAVISTASLIFIILLTAVDFATFNQSFYKHEYKKNGTAAVIGISDDELMKVTGVLLGYMKDNNDSLFVEAVIQGENREFFNQREKDHMEDVKDLFTIGYTLRKIAGIIYILTLIPVFKYKEDFFKDILKYYKIGIPAFLGVLAVLGIIIFIDFNKAFTMFHEVFFANDLWLLDPRTDLLINLVPLNFFIDIFIFILSVFVGALLLITLMASTALKKISQ